MYIKIIFYYVIYDPNINKTIFKDLDGCPSVCLFGNAQKVPFETITLNFSEDISRVQILYHDVSWGQSYGVIIHNFCLQNNFFDAFNPLNCLKLLSVLCFEYKVHFKNFDQMVSYYKI